MRQRCYVRSFLLVWFHGAQQPLDIYQVRSKIPVDISNWIAYQKYNQMYDHVYNEMLEAGVARTLDVPVWINEKGEVVKNERENLN